MMMGPCLRLRVLSVRRRLGRWTSSTMLQLPCSRTNHQRRSLLCLKKLMGKPLARDQRAELDIDGWGYDDEEGDEKGDMEAWAKLTGFKNEVDQLDDSDGDSDVFYMILPLPSGPKKCSLCDGDHYTHDCNYMDRIPPGTKIANTKDYVILCTCGGLSEDGGICDNIDCVSRGGKSRPWPPRWVIPRDEL